jgi:hypothetical protein
MEVHKLDPSKETSWDDFCLNSDDAWFWHTTKWLKYCLSYGSDAHETKDISFYIADQKGILAICPLLMDEKKDKDGNPYFEFSTAGSGGYGIMPALGRDVDEDRRERILKMIFAQVDTLAGEYNVVRALFRTSPLCRRVDSFNVLLKFGYIDSSINTQVLDLSPTQERLWGSLRKGHKYDARRGAKFYEINTYDKTDPDRSSFENYRLLHHKAAGRVTRPLETFAMMYDWILSGDGMLCGVSKEGQPVGYTYVNYYKNAAYYSSASDDPGFITDVPISHAIQWAVIQWLVAHGCATYEMGIQQFGPLLFDLPSPKDLSISFFKRGFGGRTVPVYRGIKYYDSDFMKKELSTNLEKFVASYPASKNGGNGAG